MIVGLIVFFGATTIYDRAQTYLLNNYKTNKLHQLATMAKLLDNEQHAALKTAKNSSNALAKKLRAAFAQNSVDELVGQQIFSVNYDINQRQFRYAVDPAISTVEGINVSSDLFDVMITSNGAGQLQLDHRVLLGDSPLLKGASSQSRIELQPSQQNYRLLVNGQTILTLQGKKTITGTFKNIQVSAKHATPKSAEFLFPQKTLVQFQYVLKNGYIHPPGSRVFIDSHLKKQLLNKIQPGERGMISMEPSSITSKTFVMVPISTNKSSKSRGALIMLISEKTLQTISRDFLQSVLLIFSLMTVLILLAAIFFARKITGPLEQLNLAITRLIRNDFNFKLSAKGFGSFRFLANQFNQMLAHIQRSRNELINLNKSYSRFVPHQLLKQLSTSGVNDISLGDCCEREMTVLFCDIRGFTTLSESMTPQANFNFINRYLSQIAPVINKRGGIIDKYLGDGIMALFPNGADQALKAAIEMLKALDVYNQKLIHKKLPIVEVGLGLHSGKMMLGAVGTPARMDATVVSDTVNAAARVESMTKAFRTKILITEETKRQLEDLSFYQIRYIASCRIQGKSKPVTLYEVFNNDSVSLQKEKAANQSMMIRAWKRYRQGDVASAIALYQRLIEKSPDDKSLFALIERCQSGRL